MKKEQELIHFIGIAGSGMSALAEYCHGLGMRVQGSDAKESGSLKRLREIGVECFVGHDSRHLEGIPTVVYSTAIPQENVELQTAKAHANITLLHRSELLSQLLKGKISICVAGTHGKTTTTALIFHVLRELGTDPSCVIGAKLLDLNAAGVAGNGEFIVVEADESDGTLTRYSPSVALLTNIDSDHLDFFGDEANLQKLFATYFDQVDPDDGTIIVGWDNASSRAVGQGCTRTRIAFGTWIGSDVRALQIHQHGSRLKFDVMVERDRVKVELPLLGRHNVQNALGALAVARALELDISKAARALGSFPGVERRMNLLAKQPRRLLYDDYAHNPGKTKAALEALRTSFEEFRIHVIFQPHRYSRLRSSFDEFAAAFYQADRVYVAPVYAAGEPVDERLSNNAIAQAITRESKVIASPFNDVEELLNLISNDISDLDVFVTLGAGDIHLIAKLLQNKLFGPEDL